MGGGDLTTGKILFGYGLVFLAGAMAPLGAMIAYVVPREKIRAIPLTLAFAGGVLIWVALAGLHPEAIHSFEDGLTDQYGSSGHDGHDDHSGHNHRRMQDDDDDDHDHDNETTEEEALELPKALWFAPRFFTLLCVIAGLLVGRGLDYVKERLGLEHSHGVDDMHLHPDNVAHVSQASGKALDDEEEDGGGAIVTTSEIQMQSNVTKLSTPSNENENDTGNHECLTDAQKKNLEGVGYSTLIAIVLHNFPEGLATFTSAVADPSIGILLALGVALHNIPLGIAVSMPTYFATGSRLRGLIYAALSGFTDLIGATIGLIILSAGGGLHSITAGVMFGMVAGIALWTAFKELIPEAREYDRVDKYATYLIFAGMITVDASLSVFDATGGHSH